MNTFPFDITEIANILNLNIRRKKQSNWDMDCPFCGRKGKLNINIYKNTFRCNACSESGGMLTLYSNLRNISTQYAYQEIKDILKSNENMQGVNRKDIYKKAETLKPLEPALIQSRHQVFSMMLSCLELRNEHRGKLIKRGLSLSDIESGGYRSVPISGFSELAKQIHMQGHNLSPCFLLPKASLGAGSHHLNGIPGFYTNENGDWSVNFPDWAMGIMIPIKTVGGLIAGFQIRLDKSIEKMKYTWFTSTDLKDGTSAGSPVHFVGDKNSDTIYLTEGALKANIAHSITNKAFLAVPGANQYKALYSELVSLKEMGFVNLVEAFDMDKFTNENVEKGCFRAMNMAKELGFNVRRLTWNEKYKGVDDYLVAKNMHVLSK